MDRDNATRDKLVARYLSLRAEIRDVEGRRGLEWEYASDSRIEERVRELKDDIAFVKGQIAAQEVAQTHSESAPPIAWTATDRDFSDLIIALWKKGYIRADSQLGALKTAAPHFEGVNQDPHMLLQGIMNKRDEGKGSRFDLPEPAKNRKSSRPKIYK